MSKTTLWNYNEDVTLSVHSCERGRERKGICKKALQRDAQKAFEYGIGVSDVKGKLLSFWNYQFPKENKCREYSKIYNRYMYIFDDHRLVTVIELPKEYYAYAEKLQKRKLQNFIDYGWDENGTTLLVG